MIRQQACTYGSNAGNRANCAESRCDRLVIVEESGNGRKGDGDIAARDKAVRDWGQLVKAKISGVETITNYVTSKVHGEADRESVLSAV